jgi:RNA polymerase sigma-70 factor (ECF subfamily)
MDDDANHLNGHGRAAWIAEAVERFEIPLSRYAARLVRDEDRARDVVQDTFLKLCRQDRRAMDGDLGPWLYAVCRNRAVDVLRKERGEELPADVPEPAPPAPPAAAPDLGAALRGLSRNQQEVIRLKFQQGLKYREIAAVTGLSVSNVGFLIHTGIKKLRAALGDTP